VSSSFSKSLSGTKFTVATESLSETSLTGSRCHGVLLPTDPSWPAQAANDPHHVTLRSATCGGIRRASCSGLHVLDEPERRDIKTNQQQLRGSYLPKPGIHVTNFTLLLAAILQRLLTIDL